MEEHFLANNNPTDMDSYRKFMSEQIKNNSNLANKGKELRKKRNLEDWIASIDPIYRNINLSFFLTDTQEKVYSELNSHRPGSFIIKGRTQKASLTLIHSILIKYIEFGNVQPSEIKWTSVSDGNSNINGMYSARGWKEKLFSKDTKVIVITGVSNDSGQHQERDNQKFWSAIQSFCIERDISCFVSYVPMLKGDPEIKQEVKGQEIAIPSLTENKDFNIKFLYRLSAKILIAKPLHTKEKNTNGNN